MKKIFFTLVLFSIAIFSYAQNTRFLCEIKGVEKDLSSGLKIVFDFGNRPTYSAWESLKSKQKIVDENGKEIPFNSMVDAGNYLMNLGWNFLQAYTSIYNGKAIIHWIFYKDAENAEKAIEGIMTKESFKTQENKK